MIIKPLMNTDNLSERVPGAIFEVSNALGAGFSSRKSTSSRYSPNSTCGVTPSCEASFAVTYEGQPVGEYCADVLVEDVLVVELKCAERLSNEHTAQCLNYLRVRPNPVYSC
jgi:GxxExxY protein